MGEQEYFKNALSNFMFEASSGGAIRHLADLGYTVKQISKKLEFPTPYERVRKTVWEHLVETGVLLLEEPGNGGQKEKADFVKEIDAYGRSSFRRVVLESGERETVRWRVRQFREPDAWVLAAVLAERCAGHGDERAYVSCDFGLRSRREPERLEESLQVLDEDKRDYIQGLPWERRLVYHRLDRRMREIVIRLYENGEFHGSLYFTDCGEKLIL